MFFVEKIFPFLSRSLSPLSPLPSCHPVRVMLGSCTEWGQLGYNPELVHGTGERQRGDKGGESGGNFNVSKLGEKNSAVALLPSPRKLICYATDQILIILFSFGPGNQHLEYSTPPPPQRFSPSFLPLPPPFPSSRQF